MGTNCHLWACQVSIHCVFFGFDVPFKLQCQMNPWAGVDENVASGPPFNRFPFFSVKFCCCSYIIVLLQFVSNCCGSYSLYPIASFAQSQIPIKFSSGIFFHFIFLLIVIFCYHNSLLCDMKQMMLENFIKFYDLSYHVQVTKICTNQQRGKGNILRD